MTMRPNHLVLIDFRSKYQVMWGLPECEVSKKFNLLKNFLETLNMFALTTLYTLS